MMLSGWLIALIAVARLAVWRRRSQLLRGELWQAERQAAARAIELEAQVLPWLPEDELWRRASDGDRHSERVLRRRMNAELGALTPGPGADERA